MAARPSCAFFVSAVILKARTHDFAEDSEVGQEQRRSLPFIILWLFLYFLLAGTISTCRKLSISRACTLSAILELHCEYGAFLYQAASYKSYGPHQP